jgi:C4-dicarboxylate transporter/malic acid transport protein
MFPPTRRYERKPLAEIVRNFTSNWFTATMGTGGLALALNQFPFAVAGLHALAAGLWLANIALFAVFTGLYAARWVLFQQEARRIFDHPVMAMFFGAIPMGLATIVNGFLSFGVPMIGGTAISVAHALWWVDVAMSLACGLVVPYFMFTRQQHSIEKMTAVWLIPVVAAEVAAASGALLVPHLSASEAFVVLVLGYGLWAYSVPLAMSILVLLVLRLVLHKLPERDMAASAWLALGPIGTGALGLVLLGTDAPAVFAAEGLTGVGEVAFGLGVIGGTVLWGYGAWWLLLAALKTVRYLKEGLPFNLGWWAFTFPLAVYSLATLALAHVTHLVLFTVESGILVTCLAIFWIVVTVGTAHGAWHGYLFVSPCLKGSDPAARLGAKSA